MRRARFPAILGRNGVASALSGEQGAGEFALRLTIETEQEEDGRWIADIPALPGTLVYAGTREEAVAHVQALALRVLAERLEHGEAGPLLDTLTFAAA